jgi:hypothetical protein
MVSYLLLTPSTYSNRMLHTVWTSWLFGPIMALIFPHFEGVNEFEQYIFYIEHILLTPIAPLLLYRKYGYLRPSVKSEMAAYGTWICYQLGVLLPMSLLTTVNLNYSLCHSPYDPFH